MPTDRHAFTARIFRQKLISLVNLMVKHDVFGSVRCWMYLVEWQKRRLPHKHILILLCNKITSNEIDDVICTGIPDVNMDKDLHEAVVKSMIHGPCGTFNPNSSCMIDPRALISDTVTGTQMDILYIEEYQQKKVAHQQP
ncbi:helitron_like_N domain-containing protein [Trichonephila clavipes]|nr:helitron_like_N domain-containing protein [Trichonephila clavipes]